MAVVREEVGRTVSDPAEIEDELRASLRRFNRLRRPLRAMSAHPI